jgi:hypothetical protein
MPFQDCSTFAAQNQNKKHEKTFIPVGSRAGDGFRHLCTGYQQ